MDIRKEAEFQEKMSKDAWDHAKDSYGATENAVVSGYKAVEKAVTSGYKAVENTVVSGYNKIEDAFVEGFLTKEGETVEDAKARLKAEEDMRRSARPEH